MMSRTQIALDPEIQHRARERAANLGVSFAEYVRSLVTKDLATLKPSSNPSVIFNLGDSGGTDISGSKPALLGEAVEALHRENERE